MTLPATSVFEFRTNGTLNASGFFNEGGSGTDYSQQDAVQVAYTDIVIDGSDSTKATSAATPFTSLHVDNAIMMVSGTGFNIEAIPFHIVSVAAGVATFDRSLGSTSSTGGTGDLGGAKSAAAILDAFFEAAPDGTQHWLKDDGSYTLTEAIVMANDGSGALPMWLTGYNTTRGDGIEDPANVARIAAGAFSFQFDNNYRISDIEITGTAAAVLRSDNSSKFHRLKVTNTSGTSDRIALQLLTDSYAIRCLGESTNGRGIQVGNVGLVKFCEVVDSDQGFRLLGDTDISFCTVSGCNSGVWGWNDTNGITNCTIYNNTRGIHGGNANATDWEILNNIINDNTTGIDFGNSTTDTHWYLDGNNLEGNGTKFAGTAPPSYNELTLDPEFVDAAGGDFQVGENMQGAAQGYWWGSATDLDLNVGAAQNKAAGGSNKIGKLVGFGGGLV